MPGLLFRWLERERLRDFFFLVKGSSAGDVDYLVVRAGWTYGEICICFLRFIFLGQRGYKNMLPKLERK